MHVCVLLCVQRIASALEYKRCLLAVILFLPNLVILAWVHGSAGSRVRHQTGIKGVKLIAFSQ